MDPRPIAMHEAVSAFKRTLVLEALTASGGNRSRAAAALKIERTSLLRLIRELGMSRALPDGRRGRPRSPRPQEDDREGPSPQATGRPLRAMNSGKAASARAPLTTFVV